MLSQIILDHYLIRLNLQSFCLTNYRHSIFTQVFRHGDRTPDNNGYEMYPNDPYLNCSFYPEGLGQLTIVSSAISFEFFGKK